MDEVNHVKMVVSFVCYLVVLVISLLHDGYEWYQSEIEMLGPIGPIILHVY